MVGAADRRRPRPRGKRSASPAASQSPLAGPDELQRVLGSLEQAKVGAPHIVQADRPVLHAALVSVLGDADLALVELAGDVATLLERYRLDHPRDDQTSTTEIWLLPHGRGKQHFLAVRTGTVQHLLEQLVDVTKPTINAAPSVSVAPAAPDQERPQRQPLPVLLRQWTFAEAKAAAMALADGPSLRHWLPIEGEIAMRHIAGEGVPVETKLTSSPLLDWLALPATVESLQNELRQAGIPAVLTLHVCIAATLEHYQATMALDDLISAIGWDPRSTAQRETMRRKVWRWLAMFDSAQVIGRRPGRYRDPLTKQIIDLTSRDALIKITGRRDPPQPAFDNSAPPIEVTIAAGPWLDQWRANPQVLSYFGEIRRLAALPAGKTGGAWAQAIGLALHQLWREQAARASVGRAGEEKSLTVRFAPFTRRYLLTLFPPTPTVDEILGGLNPQRAQIYWREAITLLKQAGVIGSCKELGPLPERRKGWHDDWLDQPLDIRPTEETARDVARIAQGATAAKKARAARTPPPAPTS